MPTHTFISYSTADAADFAMRLADALTAGPPSFAAWLDRRELRPGDDWDAQIVEAIRGCKSLLFVMTRDSVTDNSVCKQEWTRGLKYKKPIVPLRLHRDAEMPFRLESRQYADLATKSSGRQSATGLAAWIASLRRLPRSQILGSCI